MKDIGLEAVAALNNLVLVLFCFFLFFSLSLFRVFTHFPFLFLSFRRCLSVTVDVVTPAGDKETPWRNLIWLKQPTGRLVCVCVSVFLFVVMIFFVFYRRLSSQTLIKRHGRRLWWNCLQIVFDPLVGSVGKEKEKKRAATKKKRVRGPSKKKGREINHFFCSSSTEFRMGSISLTTVASLPSFTYIYRVILSFT